MGKYEETDQNQYHNVAFDRTIITAQLELKEDASWGKHHQR
jgi:hypothetical protein